MLIRNTIWLAFLNMKTLSEHAVESWLASGAGRWLQRHSLYRQEKRRPKGPLSGVKRGAESWRNLPPQIYGDKSVAPTSHFGGKMVLPKRIATFSCMPLLFRIQPPQKPVRDFSLFPFFVFTLSGLILLISPNGTCGPAPTLPLLISLFVSEQRGHLDEYMFPIFFAL